MNISDVLKKVLNFLDRVQEAMSEDSPGGKKITLTEIPGLVMSFIGLVPVFGKLKETVESINSMTDEERKQLKLDFANDFDIPNDEAEAKVEAAFNWILDTHKAARIVFSQPDPPGNPDDDPK